MSAGGRVRRVDDRLGLAVLRAGLSGRTLVTYARDHVTVRTPSQPDDGDGNTLDLERPPAPDELARWVERFRNTIGHLGVSAVRLRWEVPAVGEEAAVGAPAGAPVGVPIADPDVEAAAADLGLRLTARSVLLLGGLEAPGSVAGDVELRPVSAPSAVAGGSVDRAWHAATVLYRYASGEGPDDWRGWDEAAVAWRVEVQRELAAGGRAQVWLAMRHGAPVGRLTLAHDRQRLAVVEDLVVHPVHRRAGVAAALADRALSTHLDARPGDRVGAAVVPATGADHLARRLGFRPHATVWTATSR